MMKKTTIVAALVCAAAALPASADVVVSTLGGVTNGAVNLRDNPWGAEFITGGVAQQLTSAQAMFNNGHSEIVVNAYLYSDDGGLPGVELFAFDSSVSNGGGGAEVMTFDASSFFTLEANTTYHLVLGASESIYWFDTSVPNATGSGTAVPSIEEYAHNAFWRNLGSDQDHLMYAINASDLVPTPGTAVVLGLGGLVATRRRR